MAHKKGQGSSRNGRDSNSQRLGVKRFDGNIVTGGSILVRQRGRKFRPGLNVGLGKDDTLFGRKRSGGRVRFEDHGIGRRNRYINSVVAHRAAARTCVRPAREPLRGSGTTRTFVNRCARACSCRRAPTRTPSSAIPPCSLTK